MVPPKQKGKNKGKLNTDSKPVNGGSGRTPGSAEAFPHTEVMIIPEKGSPQEGKKCRDSLTITHQIQASLRMTKSPLTLLSGCWSLLANFMLTFAGSVPYMDVLEEVQTLRQPFPGSTLVPSSGLSKVTFNRVPTRDPETVGVYSEQQLLSKVLHNLACSELHYIMQPHWLCPPHSLVGQFSSISFAFLDPNGGITQTLMRSHLAMFGKAITPKTWQARPPILQCPCCHKLGDQGLHCLLPKDALCCHICRGNHQAADHTQKCSKAANHPTQDTCNCPLMCIICKESRHTARDLACPTQAAFKTPAHNVTNSTATNLPCS
jgi:hypothetical protein